MNEIIVGSKYRIKKKRGSGSFGDIYAGEHIITLEEVAVKFESVDNIPPQLLCESKIYKTLRGGVGIPDIKWYGVEGDYNVMVIELLSSTLENLLDECQRSFSLKTVLMIADQMLSRIQYIHNNGILHRDIKPENFMLGTDKDQNIIYSIDFGLSKRYIDPKTGKHIPQIDGRTLLGTARYASLNTHRGIEQSRRDDLESIAYVLIYLLKGSLPWQGFKEENRTRKHQLIYDCKLKTTPEELCSGLPVEFCNFLTSVRALGFKDDPDYVKYRADFRALFERQGFVYDYKYDWVLKAELVRASDTRSMSTDTLVTTPLMTESPGISAQPSNLQTKLLTSGSSASVQLNMKGNFNHVRTATPLITIAQQSHPQTGALKTSATMGQMPTRQKISPQTSLLWAMKNGQFNPPRKP
ncbi:CK1 family protein kinase [Trichomonas vaginalis G3]|uniref:non-specific serine/threonine protein kinase n=1 Tax=Trichomonas vaginalis (strain ATCC PRA-98 / G3) TaxID=412133 RepID=A2E8A3_TRIV3|nr:STKc CK1 domain-containing protein [Trichomonas vaginalis G3]EAY11121.1 CK1 family protein kinase [Trichomonas vaginalis G3]KAI5492577.1 STKc CK1 domain-containing protein [Trichomonas vaginalis G3]|eukprot:XP_001323344.1 CK1 family protein kinase [Trichomonas vaginalis G3]